MHDKKRAAKIFCFIILCLIFAACGRFGALTKPSGYIPPPASHDKVKSSGENRLGGILDKIQAPKQEEAEETKAKTSGQKPDEQEEK